MVWLAPLLPFFKPYSLMLLPSFRHSDNLKTFTSIPILIQKVFSALWLAPHYDWENASKAMITDSKLRFVGTNHNNNFLWLLFRSNGSVLKIICTFVSFQQNSTQNHLHFCFVPTKQYSKSFVLLFRSNKTVLKIICTSVLLQRINTQNYFYYYFVIANPYSESFIIIIHTLWLQKFRS